MPGVHLSFPERVEVARLRQEEGLSFRAIGRVLGRSHTTVAREWGRDVDGGGRYHPRRAEQAARVRRRRPKVLRLQGDPVLAAVVARGLARRWSPEQVAGRLRRQHPADRRWWVSHTAIYNAIYVLGRRGLNAELDVVLRSGRYRRRARAGGADRFPGMVSISERPAGAADRSVPGHWEGDLVEGAAKASAVATLVERTSRFMAAVSLPEGKTAEKVSQGIAAAMLDLPRSLKRSLTWDQGAEMSRHGEFTIATGIEVFFCDPHAPWQRPSNENHNGLLREYFPKRTDFRRVSDEQLQAAIAELNGRPRKILGFRTPAEVFNEMMIEASGATTT